MRTVERPPIHELKDLIPTRWKYARPYILVVKFRGTMTTKKYLHVFTVSFGFLFFAMHLGSKMEVGGAESINGEGALLQKVVAKDPASHEKYTRFGLGC